ncbi:MAG: hypothetical protein LM601_07865 [Candidatus Verstraetearchaeota archaeon]|nr:hypothetical protein [Candidatus Verstraetearchaeota archaeon]
MNLWDVDVEVRLRELLSRVENCLRCYGKFRGYGDGDRVRIRRWCHEEPWFFPPREDGDVKGFLGTGDVIFVCERPSMRGGVAPDDLDLKFYGLLEKYGFGNTHITDLVKCRGFARAEGEFDVFVEDCHFPWGN